MPTIPVSSPSTSIIVPTLEEAASVRELLFRIRRAVPDSEVIVVDDGSADGTADAAERLGALVLRRERRMGLASAVLDGFALSAGDVVGVMDADLSHPPELIPTLAALAEGGRITVASRYVAGGQISNWPLRRRLMSHVGAAAARGLLDLAVRDCMSGFFFAPRQAFERTRFRAEGFKLLLNVLVDNPNLQAVEVPYEFSQRVHGRSKLSAGEIVNFWRTLRALRA
ncbi:MAG TPA: polyprenol monophosphomannose synthase [Candidatus Thermoplasmatota archaeon]